MTDGTSRFLAEPGVLEVVSNEAGRVFIETTAGWTERHVPEMTDARAQNLARAVATLTLQHIGRERPILSATLPEGERLQFVLPPGSRRRPSVCHDPQTVGGDVLARTARARRAVH